MGTNSNSDYRRQSESSYLRQSIAMVIYVNRSDSKIFNLRVKLIYNFGIPLIGEETPFT